MAGCSLCIGLRLTVFEQTAPKPGFARGYGPTRQALILIKIVIALLLRMIAVWGGVVVGPGKRSAVRVSFVFQITVPTGLRITTLQALGNKISEEFVFWGLRE